MEMHERLTSHERGRFAPHELMAALTTAGHASLGWPEAGRLAVGSPCDLVAITLDTPRTAGIDPEQVLYAATSADIHAVIVNGRSVVKEGSHLLGDVGVLLTRAIADLDAIEIGDPGDKRR